MVPLNRLNAARIASLRAAQPTYPLIGGTRDGQAPAGYRTFHRSTVLPPDSSLATAARDLLSWQVQLRAGLRVSASTDQVAVDTVVELSIGIGRLAIQAPCRVVYVIHGPDRCEFAYGTLPGHPESGEEAFVLERTQNGGVCFTIEAFSRPATTLTKVSGPIGRRVQDILTTAI